MAIQGKLLDLIASFDYPPDHPFKDVRFAKSDLFRKITMLYAWCGGDLVIITDLLKKLRSVDNEQFSQTKYHQNLSELTVLFYLVAGIFLKTKEYELLKYIEYEATDGLQTGKMMEYAIISPITKAKLNIEVKTLTCDPIARELPDPLSIENNAKLINFYFDKPDDVRDKIPHGFSLVRSLFSPLKGAIQKISEKFRPCEACNIGVIVIQFAPSLEEFYSYLFNPKHGLVNVNKTRKYLKDFDALVLFSVTPDIDPFWESIHEKGHTVTALFTDKIFMEDLELLRLDNVIFFKDKIHPDFKSIADEISSTYVIRTTEDKNIFILPERFSPEQIDEYIHQTEQIISSTPEPSN